MIKVSPVRFQARNSVADQRLSDADPCCRCRQHSDRPERQPHCAMLVICFNRQPGKIRNSRRHTAVFLVQPSESKGEIAIGAQPLDQIGFDGAAEGRIEDRTNGSRHRRGVSGRTTSGASAMRARCAGLDRRAAQEFIGASSAACRRAAFRRMRMAPSPQAMVSLSSSNGAGRAAALAIARATALSRAPASLSARQLEPRAGKRRQPAEMVVHLLRAACSSRCGSRPWKSSRRRSTPASRLRRQLCGGPRSGAPSAPASARRAHAGQTRRAIRRPSCRHRIGMGSRHCHRRRCRGLHPSS